MTIKCGFFDCNNPAEKGKNMCQNCDKREEYKVCSACRQPEPKKGEFLFNHENFFLNKFFYFFAKKLRDKVPAQFQSKIDQLLPNLKLSAAEEKLLAKAWKTALDFVTEKGGKQDNSQWIKLCSVCNSELEEGKGKEFVNQNPEFRKLMNRLKESRKNFQEVNKKIGQAIGKEKWQKIGEEIQGELEEEMSDVINQLKQNSGNGNQNDNGNSPRNNQDNSTKITQLQQEINSLREEINDLKNSHNPTPPNPNTLQQKENKLREKEKELDKLTQNNNSSSNKQPSKNNNSNLTLYLALGAMGVIIIVLLTALLISQKKKKNEFKLTKNW